MPLPCIIKDLAERSSRQPDITAGLKYVHSAVCAGVWRKTNREDRHNTAEYSASQHITPVVLVVTDTWHADPDSEVDDDGLQEVTEKLAAGPHEAGLKVDLSSMFTSALLSSTAAAAHFK